MSRSERSRAQTTVEIAIGGRLATIRPSMAFLLPLLEYTESRFTTDERGRTKRILHRGQLANMQGDQLFIPFGAVPEVHQRLLQAGMDVEVFGPAYQQLLWTAALQSLDGPVPLEGALKAAAAGRCGLLEVRDAVMPQVIGSLCRLLPGQRILLPVAGRCEVDRLYNALKNEFGAEVAKPETWRWGEANRILIGTPAILSTCPDAWDYLLLPDAVGILGRKEAAADWILEKRPVIGLVRDWETLHRQERLRLQLTCGPVVYRQTKGGVRVRWCVPPWCPEVKSSSALERKRAAIWHNDERNDFLAAMATAWRGKDWLALEKVGLALEADDQEKARKVVLLVESLEHGRELLKRLPEWTLAGSVGRSMKEDSAALAVVGSDCVILTAVRSSSLTSLNADVVVRCDGGLGAGGLPRGWVEGDGVLVDLADDGDAAAVRATGERSGAYRRLGWRQTGMPARWATEAISATGPGPKLPRSRR